MRITCTARERDRLIKTLAEKKACPFNGSRGCGLDMCEKCLKDNIEWDIHPEFGGHVSNKYVF